MVYYHRWLLMLKWLINKRTINGCQNPWADQHWLINCFVFVEKVDISKKTYTCDLKELKVTAVEDDRYYPYAGNPIPLLDFKWLTTKGHAGFLPSFGSYQ